MERFWSGIENLQRQITPVLTFLMRSENMQTGFQFNLETFSCSICLDLLKDPVTTLCGHSYCLTCIEDHWDREDQKGIHSCPQCRETFKPRPALKKNTILAALVEQLKKTGLQDAPADLCYAGPEDVACDFCAGRKLKAIKSCLVCLASYCEKHLQPHFDSATFRYHSLAEPSKNLQENICSRHGEVMKMFCRTDQTFVCYVCPVDEHKGHDTVSAAAERSERQRELEERRGEIQYRIQDREEDVKLLQQEVEAINQSADKTVEDSQKIFTELIRLLQKRSSNVKQQIRSQQETEVSRVKELQAKLEQEISELKRKDAELKQLSDTEDYIKFLQNYSAPCLGKSIKLLAVYSFYVQRFDEIQKSVTETQKKVLKGLDDGCKTVFQKVININRFPPQPEPKTRAGFLKYGCEITLDPNTANTYISLTEENKKATFMMVGQFYPFHPDRCAARGQVLSRESLTGRCYWEVEKASGGVSVVVAYKENKTLKEKFGENEESWALTVFKRHYEFRHRKISTRVLSPGSSRVGVYLDHRAGILSFYSVSETMTLLHRVQTTFTQPLHAGVTLHGPIGNTAWIIEHN